MSTEFKEHYEYTDEARRPLLSRLRQEIRGWDNQVVESITPRQRIAYKKPDRKIFLEIKVQRHAVVLHMIDVPDPEGLLEPIPDSHEWKQLARRVKIETASELARVIPLARHAWQRG